MEIRWNQILRRDWQRLAGQSAAFQQDWAYGEACAALGSKVLRAEIRDGADTVGILQIVQRSFFGALHVAVGTRGPHWITEIPAERISDAARALAASLPLPRFRGLFLTPEGDDDRALTRSGFRRVMTPYATAEIDLTRSAGDLRSAFHHKWRNRLVAAETSDLRVQRIDGRPDRYQWLLEAEQAQQRRIGYRALPPALVSAWQAAGGSVRVYAAERRGRIVAAMLFLLHGDRATYHIGWNDPEGRQHSAHNLLLWAAMMRLPDAGTAVLDLGGINTHDSPGVARFKLGAGSRIKTLCGTWFST